MRLFLLATLAVSSIPAIKLRAETSPAETLADVRGGLEKYAEMLGKLEESLGGEGDSKDGGESHCN